MDYYSHWLMIIQWLMRANSSRYVPYSRGVHFRVAGSGQTRCRDVISDRMVRRAFGRIMRTAGLTKNHALRADEVVTKSIQIKNQLLHRSFV